MDTREWLMADLSDFLLSEYQNISQAHFKTNEMIATFFRYYVLVMTIPITVVVSAVSAGDYVEKSGHWSHLVGVLFLMIAVIGHFIGRYISGLKYKAILYARTVNGVRKYFLDTAESKVESVLPTDPSKPSLTIQTDHRNIVLTFAILTASYFFVGVIFLVDFSA
jgi:hypothetical protein